MTGSHHIFTLVGVIHFYIKQKINNFQTTVSDLIDLVYFPHSLSKCSVFLAPVWPLGLNLGQNDMFYELLAEHRVFRNVWFCWRLVSRKAFRMSFYWLGIMCLIRASINQSICHTVRMWPDPDVPLSLTFSVPFSLKHLLYCSICDRANRI